LAGESMIYRLFNDAISTTKIMVQIRWKDGQ